MDSRRLQELRDVYTQLSHQSTGPDGAQAAVVPAPAPTLQQEADVHESGRFVASSPQHQVSSANAAAATVASSMASFASSTRYNSTDSGQTGWPASSVSAGATATSKDAAATAAADGAVAPVASVGLSLPRTPAMSLLASGAAISAPATMSLMNLSPSENSGLGQGPPTFSNGPDGHSYFRGPVAPAAAPADGGGGGGGRPMGSGEASSPPPMKREMSSMSASEEHDGGNAPGAAAAAAAAAAAGTGGKKKRKRSERNSFYPGSYFEWTEELMARELPEKSSGSFAAAIFELGLKHSSPKVLMKLMPPKANSLTTEHIKSRLQKYRLHAHRSKDEFLEFFNLRLKAKFADFLQQEGWRSLPPDHGREGNHNHHHHHHHQHQHHHEESEYDSAGGGDGAVGGGGRGSAGPEPGESPAVKVDGQMVGDIRDLGARCVKEQVHLQEMLRQHISAQLKLQAEIHEHLTTATAIAGPVGTGVAGVGAGSGANIRRRSSSINGGGGGFGDEPPADAAAAATAEGGGAAGGIAAAAAAAAAVAPRQPQPQPPGAAAAAAAGAGGMGGLQGGSGRQNVEAQGTDPTE